MTMYQRHYYHHHDYVPTALLSSPRLCIINIIHTATLYHWWNQASEVRPSKEGGLQQEVLWGEPEQGGRIAARGAVG